MLDSFNQKTGSTYSRQDHAFSLAESIQTPGVVEIEREREKKRKIKNLQSDTQTYIVEGEITPRTLEDLVLWCQISKHFQLAGHRSVVLFGWHSRSFPNPPKHRLPMGTGYFPDSPPHHTHTFSAQNMGYPPSSENSSDGGPRSIYAVTSHPTWETKNSFRSRPIPFSTLFREGRWLVGVADRRRKYDNKKNEKTCLLFFSSLESASDHTIFFFSMESKVAVRIHSSFFKKHFGFDGERRMLKMARYLTISFARGK